MKVERPACAGLFTRADMRGARAVSHAVHGARALCADATPRRPGAGRVAAPWLSARLLWFEPSWLWRLPTLVASAIAPEPVASAVANAVVSAITRVVSSERVRTAAALGVLTKIRAKVRKRGKIQISAIYRL